MEDTSLVGGHTDWMSLLPEELLDVPLWNLAIPGSHDSMAFCLDISSPVVKSEPFLLRLSDQLFPCCTRPCIYRWSATQQSVLRDQCDLGIRFLDLRIAKKPSGSSKLFFAHGIYTLITVKEALDELDTWLDAHPKEIVIISCSHFECLTDEDHKHLVEFIISLFGRKLLSPQDISTLRSCWSKGQQVIVAYDNQQVVQQHPELWSGIPYWYAESPDPKMVIDYLEAKIHQGRPGGFYVCGLNLTENAFYVFLHPLQSLRTMTMKALLPLLDWTGEQQPGPEGCGVNIVCCDFVGISQFCSVVINLNHKLVGRESGTKDHLCSSHYAAGHGDGAVPHSDAAGQSGASVGGAHDVGRGSEEGRDQNTRNIFLR